MEPIEFVYDGDYDMSHMISDFCDQCDLSFGKRGNRKFFVNQVYTLRETSNDSDWYKWGFIKTINGNFGSEGATVYTGICIKPEHAEEILLYINGPNFIAIK